MQRGQKMKKIIIPTLALLTVLGNNVANAEEVEKVCTSARNYRDQENYTQAEPLLSRCFKFKADTYTKNRDRATGGEVALLLKDLAKIHKIQKNYDQAEKELKLSLGLLEKLYGKDSAFTVMVRKDLDNLRESDEVVNAKLEAKKASVKVIDEVDPLLRQAFGLLENNKYAEAEPLLEKAIDLEEKGLGKNHPEVIRLLTILAGVYKEQGKLEQAQAIVDSLEEMKKKP